MAAFEKAAPLYDHPEIYRRVFGDDISEEMGFLRRTLPSPPARVLSLGCGEGRIESVLSSKGYSLHGFDASPSMARRAVRNDPLGCYTSARAQALPYPPSPLFDAAFSLLVSCAHITDESHWPPLLNGLHLRLKPGAPLFLELPVCPSPTKLQGFRETTQSPGWSYTFAYADILRPTTWGAIIHRAISIETPEGVFVDRDPYAVFTPQGIRVLIASAGFSGIRFFAPYDPSTETTTPPADVLRAIVMAQKQTG